MKNIILTVILIVFSVSLYAQQANEQDCIAAIPVCTGYYFQPNSYVGMGFVPNEIPTGGGCPGNCMLDGELNCVWYMITVNSNGMLGFLITPNNSSDDYDWVVYDLTNNKCEDIISMASQLQVSCNWSGTAGPTGPNGGHTQVCGSAGSNNKCALIPVQEGETYVINISNWSSTQNGYALDFATSTAAVYDTIPPEIVEIYDEEVSGCSTNELKFDFSERVRCDRVTAGVFEVIGPGGPYTVTDVIGEACEFGDWENQYTLYLDKPFKSNGVYDLILHSGFNGVVDACNNIAPADTIPFTLDLGAPIIDETGVVIVNSTCGVANGSVTGLSVSGTGTLYYDWTDQSGSTVGTDLDLIDVPSGTYSLEVTDDFNCVTTAGPFQVLDEGAPTVDETGMNINSSTCSDPNGSITGLVPDGNEPFTFQWLDQGGNPAGNDIDLIDAMAGVYTLTVEDVNTCQVVAGPYDLTDIPGPTLDEDNMLIVSSRCDSLNGSITGIFTTGSTALTFEWIDGSGTSVGNDIDLIDVRGGQYTLTISDLNNCEISGGPYIVDSLPAPKLNESGINIVDADCNESNGSITGIVVNGPLPMNYSWTDQGGGVVSTQLDLLNVPSGYYTLEVSNVNNCYKYSGPHEVDNIGGADITSVINQNPTCELPNGMIEVYAVGGLGQLEYSIDGGQNWQITSDFLQLLPAIYDIQVRDEHACITTYTPITLQNEGTAVHASANSNDPVCEGDPINLSCNVTGAQYVWNGPSGFTSNQQNPVIAAASLNNDGVYNVIVITSPYNCTDTVQTTLTVLPSYAMSANISPSANPIIRGESVSFTATCTPVGFSDEYIWMVDGVEVQRGPDSVYTTDALLNEQVVSCNIYTNNSCVAINPISSNNIVMEVKEQPMHFPNSFKPSSTFADNQVFKPKTNLTKIDNYSMYIYNKWGQEIFKSSDFNTGWDGKMNGKLCPVGVYVYSVVYQLEGNQSKEGEKFELKGTVLLVQ